MTTPTPDEVRCIVEGPTRFDVNRTLEVYGDVLALSTLVPTDDGAASLDAASFVMGAQAALVAIARTTALLPSTVLMMMEGRDQ